MGSLPLDCLWALRLVDACGIVKYHDLDVRLHDLVALVPNVATAVDAVRTGATSRPGVVAVAKAAATLCHRGRVIADNEDEALRAVHRLLERLQIA